MVMLAVKFPDPAARYLANGKRGLGRRQAGTAGGRLKGGLLAEPGRLASVRGGVRAVTARRVVFSNGLCVPKT